MLVQAPVLMIMSRPVALRMVSSLVPSQALIRIFSTMKSPARGSSPETGAAPHDHVVLQILNDHRAATGIKLHVATSELRCGRRRGAGLRAGRSPAAHIRFVARSGLDRDGIDRMGCGQIERAKIWSAPGEV